RRRYLRRAGSDAPHCHPAPGSRGNGGAAWQRGRRQAQGDAARRWQQPTQGQVREGLRADGSKKNFWREPTTEESTILALAEIDFRLKSEETAYAAKMNEYLDHELKIQRKMIEAETLTIAALRNPRNPLFRDRSRLRSELL